MPVVKKSENISLLLSCFPPSSLWPVLPFCVRGWSCSTHSPACFFLLDLLPDYPFTQLRYICLFSSLSSTIYKLLHPSVDTVAILLVKYLSILLPGFVSVRSPDTCLAEKSDSTYSKIVWFMFQTSKWGVKWSIYMTEIRALRFVFLGLCILYTHSLVVKWLLDFEIFLCRYASKSQRNAIMPLVQLPSLPIANCHF